MIDMIDMWRIVLIALTMMMEARNQPELGKAMVGQVIMNRGGQEMVEQTVFAPHQFAVWGPDVYGPGHSLRLGVLVCHAMGAFPDDPWCVERWMALWPGDWPAFSIGDEEYWEDVLGIAVFVYSEEWDVPPDLADKTHFDNPLFWPEGLPPWMQNCERVGDHVFCD